MMPHEPLLEFMRRTMFNLAFVEAHAKNGGPFEATQLINSFLGALVHPWEALDKMFEGVVVDDSWPKFASTEPGTYREPEDLYELLRFARNAVAHGHVKPRSSPIGEISSLRLWNIRRGKKDWDVTITVENMRRFLDRFVDEVESISKLQSHRRIA